MHAKLSASCGQFCVLQRQPLLCRTFSQKIVIVNMCVECKNEASVLQAVELLVTVNVGKKPAVNTFQGAAGLFWGFHVASGEGEGGRKA